MLPEHFNFQRFHLGICLDLPVSDTYAFLSSADGLSAWFIGQATHRSAEGRPRLPEELAEPGDRYDWEWKSKDLRLAGEVLAAVPNELVTYTFGPAFTVTFRISVAEDGRSRIALKQQVHVPVNLGDFGYINCCVCWTFFLTNLKSVAENGADLRETLIMDEMLVNR